MQYGLFLICIFVVSSNAMEKNEGKKEESESPVTIGLSVINYESRSTEGNINFLIPPPMASISSVGRRSSAADIEEKENSSGTSLPTYTNYYMERAELAEKNKKLFRETFTQFMHYYLSIQSLSLNQQDLIIRYRTLDLGYKNYAIDNLLVYATLALESIREHLVAGNVKMLPVNENNFSLRTLNLGGNLLKSLPHELSEFKATLVELNLNDNQIEYFPGVIDDLENLCVLRLRNNRIKEIAEYHFKDYLKQLTHLDLVDNQLNSVPRGLKLLPKLKECLLYGNPHESIGAFMFRKDDDKKNVFITIDPRNKKLLTRDPLLPKLVIKNEEGEKMTFKKRISKFLSRHNSDEQ
ncbi:MAG: Leucine Rich repeats (2 copies) [Candidatus Dependentiae bacterium ADurb.Bin331]|nr:MAG: Leucine Rich repeats (2 copies) [Candidatus Dependentiae bacterium ADurb.Bin331]